MNEVKRLGTILGVFAHPDDESFTMGGLLAMATKNGQTVVCITATKGEAGTSDATKWPLTTIAVTREHEMDKAMDILGVKDHFWLDYRDGQCNKVPEAEGVDRVVEYINKYNPDTIVTFGPDGLTGHDDHKCACRWATEAVKRAGKNIALYYAVDTQEQYDGYFRQIDEKFNLYFNIDKPNLVPEVKCDLVIKLPSEILDKKILAVKTMASQTEGMFREFDLEFWHGAVAVEAFIKA